MAREAGPRLVQNAKKQADIEAKYNEALVFARSQDALNEGVKFMPPTGWALARGGRGRRDRGNRGSLIG
jgi:formylmethanofuran dehydrogenase subunit D